MGKTKNCFIVSESTGYTLNVDHDTNALELTNRSKDLWKKHNWLVEKVVHDESTYDNDFVEGAKSQSGQLRHVCESGKITVPVFDRNNITRGFTSEFTNRNLFIFLLIFLF